MNIETLKPLTEEKSYAQIETVTEDIITLRQGRLLPKDRAILTILDPEIAQSAQIQINKQNAKELIKGLLTFINT